MSWGLGHWKLAQKCWEAERGTFRILVSPSGQPSSEALQRRALVAKVATLSDSDLIDLTKQEFAKYRSTFNRANYEPYLSELARRGLADPIQSILNEVHSSSDQLGRPDDFALSVALRRAQRRPDPIKFRIERLANTNWQPSASTHYILVTVENVDFERREINFINGGDDRGGRPERWRIVLTNSQGEVVPDARFASTGMGAGVSSLGSMEFGESYYEHLNVRCFVAPPRSGEYQLQVLYHNSLGIADEPELGGLIVLRSDPINVTIHNPDDPSLAKTLGDSVPGFAALLALACYFTFSYRHSAKRASENAQMPARRRRLVDGIWCASLVLLCGLWWLDVQRLQAGLELATSHNDSNWILKSIDNKP